MTFGSLNNLLAGTNPNLVIEVGMGATQICWTDRHAFTVIAISKSGKTVTVQADTETRTDKNGMDECQSYEHTRNPEGATFNLRLTKKGWACKGQKFTLGNRSTYHDYSF